MKIFKDANGLEWLVSVNPETIKQVRSRVDFDLLNLKDGHAIEKLIDDPILLCDVLYVLCRDQAAERGVSDEQFGRALYGDAIDRGTEALLSELTDFLPASKRAVLTKALTSVRAIEARMNAKALKAMDDPAMLDKVEELMTAGHSAAADDPRSVRNLVLAGRDPDYSGELPPPTPAERRVAIECTSAADALARMRAARIS